MDKLEGRIAYLPDGQKVRIEYVADGLATVMRLDGNWRGEIAVCAVTSLSMPDWLKYSHETGFEALRRSPDAQS